MNPEIYQQAWQAHSARTRVTIDADLLLKEVERSQQNFRAMIFFRDFREVGVALLMIPLWFYLGSRMSLPWTWYLTVPVLVWTAAFMLVYRMRHKQQPSKPDKPLLRCIQRSVTEVENQIWLLRNVFWWYLLPPAISISAFFAHVVWLGIKDGPALGFAGTLVVAGALAFALLVVFAVYYFIYWLNQHAVRKQLEPRRQELLTLLASLADETENESEQAAMTRISEGAKKPGKRWWLFAVAIVCGAAGMLIALAARLFSPSYAGIPRSDGPAGARLAELVTGLRKEKQLVGLAAMVMVDGQVVAVAADGERKIGSGVSIELGDRWHLGSITKSITATMIARLVESGQMQWSDSIGKRFPEASIDAAWRSATLGQLLTHTSGAPANFSLQVRRRRPALGIECTAARRKAVMEVMADGPAHPPGEKYAYSNVGYTIAGAMAESATGVSWEDLVKREVFESLKLTGAGFGPPKSPSATLDQPRGHSRVLGSKVCASDEDDNTPIMGPAGTIHMTLRDLCTYATEHLRGELGGGKLLSTETYKRLHTPALDNYAYGWVRKEPTDEIPHRLYWHNGSNTMWYALVVFIPGTKMVVAVASNDGDTVGAESAAWKVVEASAKRFNVEGDPASR